jgi:hypothetical protein
MEKCTVTFFIHSKPYSLKLFRINTQPLFSKLDRFIKDQGVATLSKTTLSIVTFSKMTLSIVTLRITTLRIMTLMQSFIMLSVPYTQCP